jgi:hypothetical protein
MDLPGGIVGRRFADGSDFHDDQSPCGLADSTALHACPQSLPWVNGTRNHQWEAR